MKRDRGQLENIILACWQENEKNRVGHDALRSYLWDKFKIEPGHISSLISGAKRIEGVSDQYLCALAMATYEVFGCQGSNPKEFFTDAELQKVKETSFEPTNSLNGDLKFDDVSYVCNDHYFTTISSQYLRALLDEGRLIYRPETQRGTITKRQGDAIIQKVRINRNNVTEIANDIEENKYEPTTLTMNVVKGSGEMVYDARSRTLIVSKGAECNLIDGLHRTYGVIQAMIENPEIKQPWEFRIVNWSIEKAKAFIFQEDHKTPLTKEVRVSMDQHDLSTQIVSMLNQEMHNEMQGRIATDIRSITKGKAYTLFSMMVDSVRKFLKPQYQKDVESMTKRLISFYNALIPIINNKDDLMKYYLFYGYTQLASILPSLDNLEEVIIALDHNPIENYGQKTSLATKHKKTIERWINNAVV